MQLLRSHIALQSMQVDAFHLLAGGGITSGAAKRWPGYGGDEGGCVVSCQWRMIFMRLWPSILSLLPLPCTGPLDWLAGVLARQGWLWW